VSCDTKIASLDQMALYFQEAFDMLESCVDDSSLTIDNIGEKVSEDPNIIVDREMIED
jgi:diacylglycerol O-acyltransferase